MTTPERTVVAVEDAVKALTARAKLAGVDRAEDFAREFVTSLRRQGWAPCQPVTALPPRPTTVALPPKGLLDETRAALRAARPAEPEESA